MDKQQAQQGNQVERIRVRWDGPAAQYRVDKANWDGGEVVMARDFDALRDRIALESNVLDVRQLFQDKLAKAKRADHQDAPAFLDQSEAALWHQAQASALQWVLEMIG